MQRHCERNINHPLYTLFECLINCVSRSFSAPDPNKVDANEDEHLQLDNYCIMQYAVEEKDEDRDVSSFQALLPRLATP